MAGLESPTADAGVRAVAAGIRRRRSVAARKVQVIRTQLIARLVGPLEESQSSVDRRDRALLLIGFAGALRRILSAGRRRVARTPPEGCHDAV